MCNKGRMRLVFVRSKDVARNSTKKVYAPYTTLGFVMASLILILNGAAHGVPEDE